MYDFLSTTTESNLADEKAEPLVEKELLMVLPPLDVVIQVLRLFTVGFRLRRVEVSEQDQEGLVHGTQKGRAGRSPTTGPQQAP